MWYLAEPREVSYLGNSIEVFRDGRYSVKKQGRHFLIADDKYVLAEKGFSVISNDEILKWIDAVKRKDMKKVAKIREMIKDAESSCQFIEGIWK